ncbi:MAG: hypothetical protein AAB296_02580, partial [Candidatus Desantisbacteria bacterium]
MYLTYHTARGSHAARGGSLFTDRDVCATFTGKDACAILQQTHSPLRLDNSLILPPRLSLDYIELIANIDSLQQA